MNFKKSKGDVIADANEAVYATVRKFLNNREGCQFNEELLCDAIVYAMDSAVVSLVNNIYTDQEFEEDIGLNK